jgi:nucleoside-diphosphate-sugar epimerase
MVAPRRPSLVLLGASGFLGRELMARWRGSLPLRAVSRRIPESADRAAAGVTWVQADLLNTAGLDGVVERDDIVVNAAYHTADTEANLPMIEHIVTACRRGGVRRLVHCSTAVVVGATPVRHVTEATPCEPRSAYEITKLALEARVRTLVDDGVDVGILRPTAIVGPGGQNLLTLAQSLYSGSRVTNYVRASLFGRRRMNLVPVHTVAAALAHLALFPQPLSGHAYIVSSDTDEENNFASVERLLLAALGRPPRTVPVVPLRPRVLSMVLAAAGRSVTATNRVYDSSKLLGTGFTPPDTVTEAVRAFGEHFRASRGAR